MKIIKRLLWIGMALNVILLFTSAFYNKSKVLTFIVLLGTGIQAGTVLIFFRYINKPLQDLLKYRNLSDDEEKKQSIETGIQKIEDSELKNIFSSIMDYVLLVSKENNAEIFTKQTELSALQSQINPHFLYNTLDTIRGQAMIDGNKEVADMIEKLASFFRYSISRKGNMVTLRDELANVKNYISIQEYRFNNRFRLFIDIDEDEINKIVKDIGRLEQLQEETQNKLENLNQQRTTANGEAIKANAEFKRNVDSLLKNMEASDDGERDIKYSEMALRVLDESSVRLQKKKVGNLGQTITACYKKLANKKNLIETVEMDPVTLDLIYLDQNRQEVEKTSLS